MRSTGEMASLLLLTACAGGEPVATPDASMNVPDAMLPYVPPEPIAPLQPEPPGPVDLPSFLPCPPGWREVAGEPITCDPWPETGTATCANGYAHLPGESTCALIGTACPADGWPEGLPGAASTLYVRTGSIA